MEQNSSRTPKSNLIALQTFKFSVVTGYRPGPTKAQIAQCSLPGLAVGFFYVEE